MTDSWWEHPPGKPDGHLMLLPVKDQADLWPEFVGLAGFW